MSFGLFVVLRLSLSSVVVVVIVVFSPGPSKNRYCIFQSCNMSFRYTQIKESKCHFIHAIVCIFRSRSLSLSRSLRSMYWYRTTYQEKRILRQNFNNCLILQMCMWRMCVVSVCHQSTSVCQINRVWFQTHKFNAPKGFTNIGTKIAVFKLKHSQQQQ